MNSPESVERNRPEHYEVVARKYRPQSFAALIGQDHIALALSNAIKQNRVGHAYLFTGARGVGKTSSARIFAKCLNCVNGPTDKPCDRDHECDICKSISSGEDVDVLEIDGASNRGIDEIRSLRSNAAIRPSRARYKIYIIDEVHMLTSPAFNALLKTLEEPPKHVKFIFCTTDPQKIPITVLSRCQRFDFSPVQTDQIADSLKTIVTREGKTADDEALRLLARRANGSMRDSQSLLEQIFSFCGPHIAVDEVHRLLGTADIGRISDLASAMIARDPTTALNLVHQATREGVDVGQLASQLLYFVRDLMATKLNCSADTLLMCEPADHPMMLALTHELGLENLLAMLQILDTALVKMQSSLHARTLLEMAVIRICGLENLDAIPDLVKQLAEAGSPGSTVKPTPRPVVASTNPPAALPASAAQSSKPAPTSDPAQQPGQDAKGTTRHKGASAVKKNEIAEPAPNSDRVLAAPPIPVAEPALDRPQVLEALARTDQAHALLLESPTTLQSAADRTLVGVTALPDQVATGGEGLALDTRTTWSQPETLVADSDDELARSESDSFSGSDLESDTDLDFSEWSEDRASGPVPPGLRPTVVDLAHPAALSKHWSELVERLQGMTADMVRDPEGLELVEENLVRVTLRDLYTVRECLKPERRQNIELNLSEICRQVMRVDFRASPKAPGKTESAAPQLSRAQQLRILLERDFVKQAMETLAAEVKDFYQPKSK